MPPCVRIAVCQSPPSTRPAADVLVLLAVLGRYEGEPRGGAVDDHNVQALGRRSLAAGLLPPGAASSRESVVAVLAEIGQRLRYAIGESSADRVAAMTSWLAQPTFTDLPQVGGKGPGSSFPFWLGGTH